MLRAVIFDDEYIVLQGLCKMIDWSQYGIELVGTAENGKAALEMFHSLRPDIMMTDIRMPGIDGLQLIERVMDEAPETVCIVFSGFNEYEYVRTAMKLGVADYLEKPITIAKVDEAMRRTIDRIERQQEFVALKQKLAASSEELLEKATLDLLLRGGEALPKWRACFGEQDAARVAGVTVLAYSARQEPLEAMSAYRNVEITNGSEWLTVVFHYTPSADALWDQLMLRSTHMQDSVGSGKTYSEASEAGKSYKEALRALRYGRFLEEKGWTRYEHVAESDAFPAGLSEREEALLFYMRTGNREGLLQQLDAFNHWMEQERLDPDIAEQEILKLAYIGAQVARETGSDIRQTGKAGAISHRALGDLHTRDEMCCWLREQMESLFDLTAEVRHSSKHSSVDKALAYIHENYHRDLTLQEVAELVGMNTTYFSLLFKEKVGISYIKHVTKIRLEQAKQLLRSGMRVNEASEKVGYYNYRHFTELFKKHVGITPGQYREAGEMRADPEKRDNHA